MANFHSRLKQSRINKKLSQVELANLLGVTQPTIANWEAGNHIPRQAIVTQISHILSLESGWLLLGNDPALPARQIKYLTDPIQHVPIYEWLDDWDALVGSTPVSYLPFASQASGLMAIRSPDQAASDQIIYIIDVNYASEAQQNDFYLCLKAKGLKFVPYRSAKKPIARLCATLTLF